MPDDDLFRQLRGVDPARRLPPRQAGQDPLWDRVSDRIAGTEAQSEGKFAGYDLSTNLDVATDLDASAGGERYEQEQGRFTPGNRSSAWLIAAAAAIVALGVAAVLVLVQARQGPLIVSEPEQPDSAFEPADIGYPGAMVTTLPVRLGDHLTEASGKVWGIRSWAAYEPARPAGTHLTELAWADAVTGEAGSLPLGAELCRLPGEAFDAVWVLTCREPGISRIDPVTAEIEAQFTVEGFDPQTGVNALGLGEDALWVIAHGEDCRQCELVRIAPSTGEELARHEIPAFSSGLAAGFGSLWVSDTRGDEVLRVAPDTGEVVTTYNVDQPSDLALSANGVLVESSVSGDLQLIDPDRNEVSDFAVPDDLLSWFVMSSETPVVWGKADASELLRGPQGLAELQSDLVRFDPVSGEVTHRLELPGPAFIEGLGVGRLHAWVSATLQDGSGTHVLYRLPRPPPAE